jgi:hypothetical protein
MKPPPPVTGVISGSVKVLLQLTAWLVEATLSGPATAVAASAAAVAATSATKAASRFFIPFPSCEPLSSI